MEVTCARGRELGEDLGAGLRGAQGIFLGPDVRLHWAVFDVADGVAYLPSHCQLWPAQWYGCEETLGAWPGLCAKPWRMLCVRETGTERGSLVERP